MARPRLIARAAGLLCNRKAGTAVEFALVTPLIILTTFGVISLCGFAFVTSTLHYAVEDAARCASVKTTICTDNATTATYAASVYKGFGGAPVFTRTAAACGNRVTGTLTFNLINGSTYSALPLTVSACRPLA